MHLDAWLSILIENKSEWNWTGSGSPSHVIALWREKEAQIPDRGARYVGGVTQCISFGESRMAAIAIKKIDKRLF
jgi:hypothetical protein